jgi:hypothetical protein
MKLSRCKQQVVASDSMITIQDKKYIFQENNLIIFDEINCQPNILLMKVCSDYVKDIKLTKFQFLSKYAVFFFLH